MTSTSKQAKAGEKPSFTEDSRAASNDQVEVTASDSMIIAPVSQSADEHDDNMKAPEEITQASDLSRTDRRICVVTTAALPWRTGTAVNPLLRALYLTRGRPKNYVTLMIPWLEQQPKAQQQLYGQVFQSTEEQEAWIRTYCRDRCNCADEETKLVIKFWKGSYHSGFGSIFPTQDICSLIPKEEADVAILEEPEHLNWWRIPPKEKGDEAEQEWGWTYHFSYVVGVLHTNYGAYMKQYGLGTSFVTAPALNALSALVVRAYCHRLVRLSATLTSLDEDLEVTSNIHGVRDEFFARPESNTDSSKLAPVYFIGKIIWAKGFDKLLELQERYKETTGAYFPIDVYGGGEDVKAVKLAFFGRHNLDDAEKEDADSDSSKEEGDKAAAQVFANPSSLRDLVKDSSAPSAEEEEESKEDFGPADVFADLSGKTLQSGAETAAETANAALKVIESVVEHGIGAFTKKDDSNHKRSSPAKKAFSLAPVRSRFKWRKIPLPARFLGVKDHIDLRESPSQKIFLNMSITEVLCTTSAEALAMGKFVILPKHPSNDFFYSFPNCLPYSSLDECVTKMQYALENEPQPLDDETKRRLSWEGATERLYKAAAITVPDQASREASDAEEDRQKAVKFHLNSCRRSQFVTGMFSSNPIKKLSSKLSSRSDE
eukprot:scaffold4511_cov171-Amphora_coffeaeformis.AAC.13